jgi:hypothetical protein
LAQAVLQRIVDEDLEVLVGHRGVFLSKLPLKDWTFRGDVPFVRLVRPLTGLLIQGRSFVG